MKINVFSTPHEMSKKMIEKDEFSIVIDVLRATSSIISAFISGARAVYPTSEIKEAFALKSKHPELILCGEENSVLIEGFDYDNSPLNFNSNSHVVGKDLVFKTTNGTNAMLACKTDMIAICAMLNVDAVAQKAIEHGKDINIVMAGTRGRFSLDDALVAGALISALQDYADPDDLGLVCLSYYNEYKNDLSAGMRNCSHCQSLLELGFEDDVDLCTKANKTNIVPMLKDGKISL